jgi:hypothetical protein
MQLILKASRTTILSTQDTANLPAAIQAHTHIPAQDQVLCSAGRPLDLEHLQDGQTIMVTMRMPGGAPKKRCQKADCSVPALRGLDCSLCAGHFCAKHRLLEQHACSGLASAKEELRRQNRETLEQQKCVAARVN